MPGDQVFPLPEGYRLEMERFDLKIYRGDTQVGGILRTSLQQDSLTEEKFLETNIPRSAGFQYSLFAVNGRVSLDWKSASSESQHTYHTFFERYGEGYDLWLDMDLVNINQRIQFLEMLEIPNSDAAD